MRVGRQILFLFQCHRSLKSLWLKMIYIYLEFLKFLKNEKKECFYLFVFMRFCLMQHCLCMFKISISWSIYKYIKQKGFFITLMSIQSISWEYIYFHYSNCAYFHWIVPNRFSQSESGIDLLYYSTIIFICIFLLIF